MAILTVAQAKKLSPGSSPGRDFVCDSCGKLIGSLHYKSRSGKDGCSAECRDRLEEDGRSKKEKTMKKDKKEDTKKKKKDDEELEEPEDDETETASDDAPEDEEETEEETEAEDEETEAEEEEETPKKKKGKKSAKKKSKKDDDEEEEEAPKKKKKKKSGSVHSLREGSYVRKLFERLVEAKGQWVSKKILYKGLVRPFAKVYSLKQMAAKYGWDYQEKKGIMDLTGSIKLVVPKEDVKKALGDDE